MTPAPAPGRDAGFTVDGVRAVLFDVDGTLYAQPPVRLRMAAELAAHALGTLSPRRARHLARVIRTFRRTREELRGVVGGTEPLDQLQFVRTADRLGIAADDVRLIVDEWMMTRPLKHLRRARHPGLTTLLDALTERGLLIGALSDYPADAKLQALGVAEHFSISLCTADRAINAFKPHPRGFWHACEIWGVAPEEVLYVGDRSEVDGVGAAAAGTRCVIIGGRSRDGHPGRQRHPAVVAALDDLTRAFVAA